MRSHLTVNRRRVRSATLTIWSDVQRMSGIATATAAMVAACNGTRARVLETRKTAPGLRLLDKWAVLIGGGCNHRIGLYDMIMIKDNHIAAAGGLRAAVDAACSYAAAQERTIAIEVETRTEDEVQELLACLDAGGGKGVTRVMLDNMAVRDAACAGASSLQQRIAKGGCDTEKVAMCARSRAIGGVQLEVSVVRVRLAWW